MATYRLPPAFYEDHCARDLPAGTVVRTTKRSVYVELDADDYAELLSDARHYADRASGFDGLLGLRSSARATVNALVALGAPEDEHAEADAEATAEGRFYRGEA